MHVQLQAASLTVGFYGPKSRVTARGAHAAQTRACQDEEPKTEQTAKWHGGAVPHGTVVPPVIFCRLVLAARVFPRGENPTFQALYKEGQA